jgi:hypothetical protein
MHIGVTRPNHRGIDDVDAVVAIGSLAEEMQFDSCGSVDGAMPFLAAERLKRYQEVGVSHVIFSLEAANSIEFVRRWTTSRFVFGWPWSDAAPPTERMFNKC